MGRRNTGTTLRFRPDPSYFDSPRVSRPRLKHLLRAKAVLCPGLEVVFRDEAEPGEDGSPAELVWFYEDGLRDYLVQATEGFETVPVEPFVHGVAGNTEAVDWALQWLPEGGELVTESYVNLIPTAQGGTHVNGLR